MKIQLMEFNGTDANSVCNEWLATKPAKDIIAILPVPHHCVTTDGMRTTQIFYVVTFYDQEL